MLTRVTFALVEDSRQRFTHFVEPDGTVYATQRLDKLTTAKVAVSKENSIPTDNQWVAMGWLLDMALKANPNCAVEYGPGVLGRLQ